MGITTISTDVLSDARGTLQRATIFWKMGRDTHFTSETFGHGSDWFSGKSGHQISGESRIMVVDRSTPLSGISLLGGGTEQSLT
eukprot:scaffold3901_cov174-Amphora_coffeaeformis.AAC.3